MVKFSECPKCGYARKETDEAPDWQCPSCGVAYNKVSNAKQSTRNESGHSTVYLSQHERISNTRISEPVKLVLVAFVFLILGYFAGREHLKYELKQTFTKAAEEMQKGLSEAFGGSQQQPKSTKPVRQPPKPEKKIPRYFDVAMVKKGFMESDYKAGRPDDAITFTILFKNKSGRNIRAFDGDLTFTDLLDNKILSANVAINESVGDGDTLRWPGKLNFNQFIDRHQRLKNAEFENLKVLFELEKVLFSDGSVQEIK